MFGSQALETVIGLLLMFFVIALGASSVVEIVSRVMGKRASDLERAIGAMLAGTDASDEDVQAALGVFRGTAIYDAAKAAAGKTLFKKDWKLPSYISAKAFADAINEISDVTQSVEQLPAKVQIRVQTLQREFESDLTNVKAGLEAWFDESMDRLSGAYKRWSTAVLFVIGLVIVVTANASAFHVAEHLWHDPVTREAVADAASKVASEGKGATELKSIAETTDELTALQLPVGWTDADRAAWGSNNWFQPWDWTSTHVAHVVGWLVTALLVMLGAPFWYDMLTKAVALRSSGAKPDQAPADKMSASSAVFAAKTPAAIQVGLGGADPPPG